MIWVIVADMQKWSLVGGVDGQGGGVGEDEPVFGLDLEEGVNWRVSDAFVFEPLVGFEGIDLDEGAFPEPDHELGVLPALAHEDGGGEAG